MSPAPRGGAPRGCTNNAWVHAARLGSLQAVQNTRYLSNAQAGAYTSGDRFRTFNGNPRKKSRRDDSPEQMRSSYGADIKPTRESVRSRKRVNYADAEAFGGITDDEDLDAGNKSDEERKQKQKNAVAAFDDTSELDDEVEKVLAHRCGAPDGGHLCLTLGR